MERKSRYSKKRQAILDCLRKTVTHPTAEWIYGQLKPFYPDLSLATVYRNLGQLKESGEIVSVGTVLGQERFDGTNRPHVHMICSRCGTVTDVPGAEIPEALIGAAEKCTGYSVFFPDIRLFGSCPTCAAKKN